MRDQLLIYLPRLYFFLNRLLVMIYIMIIRKDWNWIAETAVNLSFLFLSHNPVHNIDTRKEMINDWSFWKYNA